MASLKQIFGASTAITITLNSLGSGAARESTAVDNSTNLYLDALVTVVAKLATGTPGSERSIYIYAYGSEDGTNYGDNASGTDAALTMRSPHNLKLLDVLNVPDAGALTYKSQPISIAQAFGGVLPRKWGIVVVNASGLALNSTGCSATYSGVYYQTV